MQNKAVLRNFYDIPHFIDAFIYTDSIIDRAHEKHQDKGEFTPCKIIGISIYKNEAITAIIKLEDGCVFTYIPFHRLFTKEDSVYNRFEGEVKNAHFINAPDFEVAISELDCLKATPVQHYDKFHNVWTEGQYHFTIDFVNDNSCVSLIELSTGELVLTPFHKIKFVEKDKLDTNLSGFKKQRETFVV